MFQRPRNRGKRNKKKKQQQPAFVITPKPPKPLPLFYMAPVGPNKSLVKIPISQKLGFQAPHHQQETMVELSDDTSPNTPLVTTTGGWKPLQTAASTSQSAPAPELKMATAEKTWQEFKSNINTTTSINKIWSNGKDVKEQPKQPEVPQKKPESTEIKWELNVLDEKDSSATAEVNKEVSIPTPEPPPKPQVVQGTASEIKLFQSKDKPFTVQKPFEKQEVKTAVTGNTPTSSSTDIFEGEMQNLRELSHYNRIRETHIPRPPIQSYPAGIPRSFLRQQISQQIAAIGSTEPQEGALSQAASLYENQGLEVNTNQFDSPMYEQQYSPSDVYDEGGNIEQGADGSESPDGQGGMKRLSAFRRLGPVSQPKKPKLTINLVCNKDSSVREVLEDENVEYTPVHLRKDVIESSDEIVKKYLPFWPWKRHLDKRKSVTNRNSKSVMLLEQEQMEEVYEKDNCFIQITACGYPRYWKKEHVLDTILDSVKGKSLIPCFIEFTKAECKFLVIRSRSALIAIHKMGFLVRKDDVELSISIALIYITTKHLEFIPRLVLRKLLSNEYDGERKLSLKEFTLKSDLSNFIYFPLNRGTNQTELMQIQSTVAWDFLTDLDLSYNRITSLDGLDLPKTTPKLKHLDLSYNWLEKVTLLLHSRELSLRSLKLEGNPLCHDYIDPGHYVRVVKMIFPALTEIDGVPIHLKGDLPKTKRNFCPSEASAVADRFLEVFFPLLEVPNDERDRIEDMYDEKAVLTVTYTYNLRYSPLYRKFRNIFLRARQFDERNSECIEGAASIARLICKWPMIQHDPYTFTVDVMHHSENSTILRVDGILKLTSESLAEDEPLLAFTRTIVLITLDGAKYKILHEMVYWDEPSQESAARAFQVHSIRTTNRLCLKLDSAPDEDLKKNLTEIFIQITDLDEKSTVRCLELKEWNLKSALEYFMKLVKLDNLQSLRKDLEMDKDISM